MGLFFHSNYLVKAHFSDHRNGQRKQQKNQQSLILEKEAGFSMPSISFCLYLMWVLQFCTLEWKMYCRHSLRMKSQDRILIHFFILCSRLSQPHMRFSPSIELIFFLTRRTCIMKSEQLTPISESSLLVFGDFWIKLRMAFPQFFGMFFVSFRRLELWLTLLLQIFFPLGESFCSMLSSYSASELCSSTLVGPERLSVSKEDFKLILLSRRILLSESSQISWPKKLSRIWLSSLMEQGRMSVKLGQVSNWRMDMLRQGFYLIDYYESNLDGINRLHKTRQKTQKYRKLNKNIQRVHLWLVYCFCEPTNGCLQILLYFLRNFQS